MRRALLVTALLTVSAAPATASRWVVTRLPMSAGGSYAEPGIVAGPPHQLAVVAASANTGAPPTFWVSHDSGLKWSSGRDLDPSGASTGDADAAFGADGWMYVLNLGYSGSSNPAVEVYRSPNGRTWSGPASFPPPHGTDQPDRPWLVVDPRHPADVDVVNSEVAGNFVIWRSDNHGASFTGPVLIGGATGLEPVLALSSRPLFDPSRPGRMFMFYVTASAAGVLGLSGGPLYEFPMTQLWLATSTDGGRSWSDRVALDTSAVTGPLHDATIGHLLPATAIDRAGRLYAAFSARPSGGTRTSIWMIRSSDHGSSWSAPVQLAAPTASNVMPALAVTPSGRTAFLSWYGSYAADYRSPSARWIEMTASVSPPLMAAANAAPTSRQVVHVGGIDTAGTVGSDLGADWSLRDFQGIALDACGGPHPVWGDDAHTPAATYTARFAGRCPSSRGHSRRRHKRRRHR